MRREEKLSAADTSHLSRTKKEEEKRALKKAFLNSERGKEKRVTMYVQYSAVTLDHVCGIVKASQL